MATNVPTLVMWLDPEVVSDELRELYAKSVQKHNDELTSNAFHDSGFDLMTPNETDSEAHQEYSTVKVDYGVCCEMFSPDRTPLACYMYPRSSISKTRFRLANNTGIIDSGYRGHLMGMFDVLPSDTMEQRVLSPHTRLTQICSPNLSPFRIELVSSKDQLSSTPRGDNGVGSTGESGSKQYHSGDISYYYQA